MLSYTDLPLIPTQVIGSHGIPGWLWVVRDAVFAPHSKELHADVIQASIGRAMALAFGEHGITVNNVSPGLVVTPLWRALEPDYRHARGKSAEQEIADRLAQNPLHRPIDAEEIARVVVFLAADESAAIIGQVVNVTGSAG